MNARRHHWLIRTLLLTLLALGAATVGPLQSPAKAVAPHEVERRLPLDANGRIAVADVTRALLPWLQPRDRREIAITTEAAKRLAGPAGEHILRMWNIQGRVAGVTFSVEGDELVLLFDTQKIKRHGLVIKGLARRMARTAGTGAGALVARGAPAKASPVRVTPAPDGSSTADRPSPGGTAVRGTRPPRGSRPAVEPGLIRVADSKKGGPPVVLVHGLDGHVSSFAGAATELGRLGYDVYVLQWSAGQSVPDAAAFLGGELRKLHQSVRKKLSLVTTSLGGVIAAWYVEQDPTYDREVGRLIACCPPFKGAPLAAYHPRSALTSLMGQMAASGMGPLFVFNGLGDAAADVVPGSSTLRTLERGKRRKGVRYSILAGNKPLLPEEVLVMAEGFVKQGAQSAQGAARDLMDWLGSVAREARAVGGGRGDGVVPLASTKLAGVRDREVLPVNHMEFLATPRPEAGPAAKVPALDAVVKRLPRAR